MNFFYLCWFVGLFGFVSIFISGMSTPLSIADEEARPAYHVYRGVSHIHSQHSHDSKAPLSLVLQKARTNDLDFVIITDHNSLAGRKAYGPNHPLDRPLVIFGDEISTPDGHLIALGIEKGPREGMGTQELIDWIHGQEGYAIIPHPFSARHPWKNWGVKGWDGLEIYNFGHELFEADVVSLYLRSIGESNESLLKSVQKVSPEHFSFWDEQLTQRKIVGFAGSDAHLKQEKRWFTIAMASATVYVLSPKLDESSIIDAIAQGGTFTVFETNGLAKGFDFWAETEKGRYHMGEEIQDRGSIVFHVHLPGAAKIVLVRNGSIAAEKEAQDFSFTSVGTGAYRIEVYRDGRLWLFTNPIYVRNNANRVANGA